MRALPLWCGPRTRTSSGCPETAGPAPSSPSALADHRRLRPHRGDRPGRHRGTRMVRRNAGEGPGRPRADRHPALRRHARPRVREGLRGPGDRAHQRGRQAHAGQEDRARREGDDRRRHPPPGLERVADRQDRRAEADDRRAVRRGDVEVGDQACRRRRARDLQRADRPRLLRRPHGARDRDVAQAPREGRRRHRQGRRRRPLVGEARAGRHRPLFPVGQATGRACDPGARRTPRSGRPAADHAV